MKRPVSMWKQVAVSALLVGGAVALWLGQDLAQDLFGSAAAPQSGRAQHAAGVPVMVAPVGLANDDLVLEAVGTGRAQRSVSLRPESEGKVVELALAPGRRFEVGDVVLRLDDRDQRLALTLAETRLAEAERVLQRFSRLESSGATSTATLDESRTAAEVARIELERAREALADRELRVPFAGVAGLPAIEVGDWIDSEDEVATYDDRSVVLVEFDLPEALLARVVTGLPVTARTPAFGDREFEGEVAAIDSRVEAESRTARVRVAVPNEEDLLRPGASFSVRLDLPGERYPMVHELAVQFSRGTLHVWRIADGTAEQVEVSLVRRLAGKVLVDGNLSEGDLVVTEGTQRLRPGKPVTVVDEDAPATAEGES